MHPIPSRGREPALNMPGVLVAAIAVLLLLHAGRGLLSDLSDLQLLLDAGFVPARLSVALGWADADAIVRAAGEGAASDPDVAAARGAIASYVVEDGGSHLWSLLTYGLLHGSWMHVGLNCVWLAAFGTPVIRRLGPWRSFGLAIVASVAGAVAYWLVNPLSVQVVIGASGAVSGLMGAAALFVFGRSGATFDARGGGYAAVLARGLGNRSALGFLAVWLAVNVLVGLVATPLGIVEGGIAWEAHIGGLIAGLLLFPLLDPVPRWPSAAG